MNPPIGVATRVPAHRDLRPLAPAGTNPLGSPSGAEQGERTILVAEDDHSCRSALLQYFERSGYRVTEAADGPSTLRAVFQHSASLVILDLGLPGFDGTDVLAKIRRHSAVPVIVCSGRDSEDDRIRTLNLGADDFVVKPFPLPNSKPGSGPSCVAATASLRPPVSSTGSWSSTATPEQSRCATRPSP